MTRLSRKERLTASRLACGMRACGMLAAFLAAIASLPAAAQTSSQPAAQPAQGATQPAPNTATLKITVSGLESNDGALFWTLYNSQDTFEAFDPDTALAKGKCQITDQSCTITVENVPYGEYAVLVAHDVNGDGEIDRNPLSDELKGVSNYTSKLWWKPNWDDAKFTINKPSMAIAISVY